MVVKACNASFMMRKHLLLFLVVAVTLAVVLAPKACAATPSSGPVLLLDRSDLAAIRQAIDDDDQVKRAWEAVESNADAWLSLVFEVPDAQVPPAEQLRAMHAIAEALRDLGLAFQITGNHAYAASGRLGLFSLADQLNPDTLSPAIASEVFPKLAWGYDLLSSSLSVEEQSVVLEFLTRVFIRSQDAKAEDLATKVWQLTSSLFFSRLIEASSTVDFDFSSEALKRHLLGEFCFPGDDGTASWASLPVPRAGWAAFLDALLPLIVAGRCIEEAGGTFFGDSLNGMPIAEVLQLPLLLSRPDGCLLQPAGHGEPLDLRHRPAVLLLATWLGSRRAQAILEAIKSAESGALISGLRLADQDAGRRHSGWRWGPERADGSYDPVLLGHIHLLRAAADNNQELPYPRAALFSDGLISVYHSQSTEAGSPSLENAADSFLCIQVPLADSDRSYNTYLWAGGRQVFPGLTISPPLQDGGERRLGSAGLLLNGKDVGVGALPYIVDSGSHGTLIGLRLGGGTGKLGARLIFMTSDYVLDGVTFVPAGETRENTAVWLFGEHGWPVALGQEMLEVPAHALQVGPGERWQLSAVRWSQIKNECVIQWQHKMGDDTETYILAPGADVLFVGLAAAGGMIGPVTATQYCTVVTGESLPLGWTALTVPGRRLAADVLPQAARMWRWHADMRYRITVLSSDPTGLLAWKVECPLYTDYLLVRGPQAEGRLRVGTDYGELALPRQSQYGYLRIGLDDVYVNGTLAGALFVTD